MAKGLLLMLAFVAFSNAMPETFPWMNNFAACVARMPIYDYDPKILETGTYMVGADTTEFSPGETLTFYIDSKNPTDTFRGLFISVLENGKSVGEWMASENFMLRSCDDSINNAMTEVNTQEKRVREHILKWKASECKKDRKYEVRATVIRGENEFEREIVVPLQCKEVVLVQTGGTEYYDQYDYGDDDTATKPPKPEPEHSKSKPDGKEPKPEDKEENKKMANKDEELSYYDNYYDYSKDTEAPTTEPEDGPKPEGENKWTDDYEKKDGHSKGKDGKPKPEGEPTPKPEGIPKSGDDEYSEADENVKSTPRTIRVLNRNTPAMFELFGGPVPESTAEGESDKWDDEDEKKDEGHERNDKKPTPESPPAPMPEGGRWAPMPEKNSATPETYVLFGGPEPESSAEPEGWKEGDEDYEKKDGETKKPKPEGGHDMKNPKPEGDHDMMKPKPEGDHDDGMKPKPEGDHDMMKPSPNPRSGDDVYGEDDAMKPRPEGDHDMTTPEPEGDHDMATPEPEGDHDAMKPKPEGDHDMTKPKPEGDHDMAKPKPEGDHDMIKPKPEGDHDMMKPKPEGDHDMMKPKPEGDHDIMKPKPEGDHDMMKPKPQPRSGDDVYAGDNMTEPMGDGDMTKPMPGDMDDEHEMENPVPDNRPKPLGLNARCENPTYDVPAGASTSFERYSYGAWTNGSDSDLMWLPGKGNTSSPHTGPDRAYEGQNYLYMEGSRPGKMGNKAILTGPRIRGCFCIKFACHMMVDPETTLELKVNGVTVNSGDFSHAGWQMMTTTVDKPGESMIEIVATKGPTFRADVGIDDIGITPGTCPEDM